MLHIDLVYVQTKTTTYIDCLLKLLRVDRLQDWHHNPDQLLRIFEILHIKVCSTALRVERIQLPPADWARRQRLNRGCTTGRLSHKSLSLGVIEAIGRLSGCWSFTIRFLKEFYTGTMHAFQELLYTSIDWVLGVPVMVST